MAGLTRSGLIAAALVGGAAIVAGVSWLVVLLLYFAAATAVSRFGREAKTAKAGGVLEKSGSRDAFQVLANGGAFAVGTIMYALVDEPAWLAFAAGALAASSSDTWATELGLLSSSPPRSIVTGKPVQPGASGGVTLAGTGGGGLGALLVAGAAALLAPEVPLAAPFIGGVAGMLVDSLVGATIQERRWCVACGRGTERLVHRCGAATEFAGGVRGVRNDLVNAIATTVGGAVSLLLVVA
ncbi:MAG TPA: DUF92 domain-containing protein [Gemmatimonadaceae bacterium]